MNRMIGKRNFFTPYLLIPCLSLSLLISCNRIKREDLQKAVDPLNKGNPSEAIKRLEQLKLKHPDNSQIHYYLGLAYLRDKKISDAYKNIGKALILKPGYTSVVGDVKLANFLTGNSNEANDSFFRTGVRELKKIIREHENTEISDEIRFHIGTKYLKKKRYGEAQKNFQTVIDNPPSTIYDAKANIFIGNIYFNHINEIDKALVSFQSTIDSYPDTVYANEALYFVGSNFMKKMELHKKRHLSLMEFFNSWKGVDELREDRETAIKQAKQDLIEAERFQKKALHYFDKIIESKKEGTIHQKALRLAKEANGYLADLTL